MTPKELAKELLNKYCYAIRTEERDSGYFTNILYAKDCALIAVDEILTALDEHQWQNRNVIEFYLCVKQDIINL
jgi:hypothetical protein